MSGFTYLTPIEIQTATSQKDLYPLTAQTNDDTAETPGFLVLWPDGRMEADGVVRRLLHSEDSADKARLACLLEDVLPDLPSDHSPRNFEVSCADGSRVSLEITASPLDTVTVVTVRPAPADAKNFTYQGLLASALVGLHHQNAHELRGPLNSMSLNLALLGRAARGELGDLPNVQEKQQEWVEALRDAVASLSKGLDRWSTLAAPGAAAGSEGSSGVDLRKLLIDLDVSLTPLAGKLARQLEIEIPDNAVWLDVSPKSFMRQLAALTCASLESLPQSLRLRVSTRPRDGEIDIEAITESSAEVESEDDDGTDGTGEASEPLAAAPLISTLIPALHRVIAPAGGRLHPLEATGWRMTWPAPQTSAEEDPDDA